VVAEPLLTNSAVPCAPPAHELVILMLFNPIIFFVSYVMCINLAAGIP